MMKKMMTMILGLIMMSMLAACGDNPEKTQDTFTFGADQAMEKARKFVEDEGAMNTIVEVLETYEYTTEQGAKGVIFEVRLGTDNMTNASTDFIRVWKNNANTTTKANWSDKEELEEKKNLYQ